MRNTAIGIVMLNDERPHVYNENNPANQAVVDRWAELIGKNLVNIDGTTPKIIKGRKIIVNIRTAQAVGEQLAGANVKQVIMCYNVWDFPFLAWPFVNSLDSNVPILSLSNNNGQFPGNVVLLATDGALRQAGRRTHRIVGEIDDGETLASVIDWCRASQAVTTIRNEVFGCYGGHSMGMETGYFHLTPTIKTLGTTVRQIDQLWLVETMKTVNEKEVSAGLEWFESLLGKRLKYDGHMLTPETLKQQIRLYLAMCKVNKEKGFDFCGLKGQRELTEYICLGDVAEMLMNDPYDWRGAKEPVVCATEADAYAGVTMQLLKYITGGLPTLFMDVRLYLPELDLWDWCNSGNHSSYYATHSFDAKKNYRKITFHPALEHYFKAGGASVEFDAKPGPYTFARLGLWDEKPFMFIVGGKGAKLNAAERKQINESTDPTWPHLHAKLDCSFDQFLALFPCNHVIGVPGDHIRKLAYLCEIAGITPVIAGPEGARRQPPIWELVR